MAWGAPSNIGTGRNKASSTTVVLTTTVAIAADEVAVVIIAADNTSTVDGDNGEVSSITDSAGGNTWTKAREFTNSQGAANAGATVSVWFSKLTNGIALGGTITANFGTARTAKAITGFKATVGAGNVVTVDADTAVAGDALDPPAMDLVTMNILRELLEDFKAWRRGERRVAPYGTKGRIYARKGEPQVSDIMSAAAKWKATLKVTGYYNAAEDRWYDVDEQGNRALRGEK